LRRSSALLVLVTLIAACSPEPSDTPAPSSGPTPGPTSTPVTSPVVSPSDNPSLAPAAWTEAFSSELSVLDDVVAGPLGLIAVGCVTDADGNCVRALLLTSSDGASWTQVDVAGAADTLISRVRWVGDRLFALGYRIDNQALTVDSVVWGSLDGLSWSGIPSASVRSRVINDVIDSPVGTLAFGINAPYASEGSGVVVWDVAPDGSFGKPRDVRPTDGPDYVAGATWTGDRFLAWGLRGPLGEVRSSILMTSLDGKVWTVLPEIPAFRDSSVTQLIAVGDRLVAVGFTGTSQLTSPRAWTSVDGTTWEAAEVPPDSGAMYTVTVEGSQLVARGREPAVTEERSVTWTSIDGEVWTRLPAGENMPDLTGFSALSRAEVGGRACVAGTFYGEPRPEPRAAIYCR